MEVLLVPEDLVLTRSDQPDMKWVVTVGDSTPMRLTSDLARVLNWYMDGQPGTIDSYLGVPVTTQQLETATTLLVQSGFLVNPETCMGGQIIRIPSQSQIVSASTLYFLSNSPF